MYFKSGAPSKTHPPLPEIIKVDLFSFQGQIFRQRCCEGEHHGRHVDVGERGVEDWRVCRHEHIIFLYLEEVPGSLALLQGQSLCNIINTLFLNIDLQSVYS